MLFEDVVNIISEKTPEEVEKIFKIRFYSVRRLFSTIKDVLDFAPPCPTLSEDEQQEMKHHLKDILKVSPAELKTLSDPRKRYWVYAHLIIKCTPDSFITTHSKEDVAEDDDEEEEEESKVHNWFNFNSKRKMAAYIMLRGKRVPITEIHSVESNCFEAYLDTEFDGEIPIKIKSRCLEKALEFCEERALFRRKYSSIASMVAFFDRKFRQDLLKSNLNLVDLIHAAGRLGITNLVNLLFEDVVDIICSKKPEEVEKIFKPRYYSVDWLYPIIKDVLDFAPPCPTLSKEQQEDVKLHRKNIMKVSPAEFIDLPPAHNLYWVYAHHVINCNPDSFITTHNLSKEDAAEDDEEEESKVDNWLRFHPQINFNSERKMAVYIMLRGEPVPITEIHSVESRCFEACLDTEFDGEIPIKIKSRCLEKALEFCERRAVLRMNDSSPASLADFDRDFLDDVLKSDLNLIDLILAAGRLGINNLVNLLFDDVYSILCDRTPEQVEMIFKVRYNGDYLFCSLINELLDFAPPCPILSIHEQEEIKLRREEILKVSPADFTKQLPTHKQYWVYAHLVIKSNLAMFIAIHEDAAEDDEVLPCLLRSMKMQQKTMKKKKKKKNQKFLKMMMMLGDPD